jgi:hypothetical protein
VADRVSLGGSCAVVRFPVAQIRRTAVSDCWRIRCGRWDSTYLFDGFDVVAVRDSGYSTVGESSMPNSSAVPGVLGMA